MKVHRVTLVLLFAVCVMAALPAFILGDRPALGPGGPGEPEALQPERFEGDDRKDTFRDPWRGLL